MAVRLRTDGQSSRQVRSRNLGGFRQGPTIAQLGETLALEADTYLFIQYKTAKGRLYYLVSRIFFASV